MMESLARRAILGFSATACLLIVSSGMASAFESRNFWKDDCPNPIVLKTGTIGYHYSYPEQYGTGVNKNIYWGWVDLPNPYRSWNTYSTTMQIYTESSNVWYDLPYLQCDYYG